MASLIIHTLLTATWHTADALLWYGLQFLNYAIDKVLYILWMMQPLSNPSRKNTPGMFYWGEVWRTGWPVHHIDTFAMKGGNGHTSCVGTCTMLHYNEYITSACMLPDNMLHDITTMYCFRYTASSKHMQVCTTIQWYLDPDHGEPPSYRSTWTMLLSV